MVQTRSDSKFIESQYFKKLQKQALETKQARKMFQEFYEKYELSTPIQKSSNNLYTMSKNKKFFKDIYNCEIVKQ